MVTTSGTAAGKEHGGKKRDDFSGFLTIEGLTPAPKQAGINSYMSTILLPLHALPPPRERATQKKQLLGATSTHCMINQPGLSFQRTKEPLRLRTPLLGPELLERTWLSLGEAAETPLVPGLWARTPQLPSSTLSTCSHSLLSTGSPRGTSLTAGGGGLSERTRPSLTPLPVT